MVNRKLRLGLVLNTFKNSMAIIGIIMSLIGLIGWHQLVFYKYIPNLWAFLALFSGIFALLMLVQYLLFTPAETAFIMKQMHLHDEDKVLK
jgi:TctA family transporter